MWIDTEDGDNNKKNGQKQKKNSHHNGIYR